MLSVRDYPAVAIGPWHLTTSSYLGPILFGQVFETLLVGGLLIHTLNHYHLFGRDPLQFLWLAVLVLTIAAWALDTATIWQALIYSFGDFKAIAAGWSTLWVRPIFTELVAFITQTFFAWRCWKILRRSWLFAFIVGMLILATLGCGLANTTMKIIYAADATARRALRTHLVQAWLITQVVTDFFIVSTFVGSLFHLRSATHFEEADSYLTRLIKLTMESALLPSIFALADLICFKSLAIVDTTHFFFQLALAPLYAWSLLITLTYAMSQTSVYHADEESQAMSGMQSTASAQQPDVQDGKHEARFGFRPIDIDTQTAQQAAYEKDSGSQRTLASSPTSPTKKWLSPEQSFAPVLEHPSQHSRPESRPFNWDEQQQRH